MTPSAIEPATFHFAAQRLNHRATAVPNHVFVKQADMILCRISKENYTSKSKTAHKARFTNFTVITIQTKIKKISIYKLNYKN